MNTAIEKYEKWLAGHKESLDTGTIRELVSDVLEKEHLPGISASVCNEQWYDEVDITYLLKERLQYDPECLKNADVKEVILDTIRHDMASSVVRNVNCVQVW